MKVLHIQREIPHYKKTFFEGLAASDNFHYTLILIKSYLTQEYPGSLTLDELVHSGINCIEIVGRSIKLFTCTIEIYPALLAYIFRNRPEVIMEGGLIFCGSKYIDAFILYILKWIFHVRFVSGWSGNVLSHHNPIMHFLRKVNHKVAFGYFDAFATYGERSKSVLLKLGVREKDIFVAYNSLDTQKLENIKRRLSKDQVWKERLMHELGLNRNDRVVLFLSRISPHKRLDLLIKAFPIILKSEPSVILLVVGDGELVAGYETLAKQAVVHNRVIFKNGVYDDFEIAKYFLLSDVAVYPGWISLSTQFAMIMGTPFVCVPLGNEVEYAINGKNCLHFSPDNEEDLAAKVTTLLQDTSMQTRFGQASQEFVAKKANIRNKLNGYRKSIEYAYHK